MRNISIYSTSRLLYPPLKTKLTAGEGYWSGILWKMIAWTAVPHGLYPHISTWGQKFKQLQMRYGTLIIKNIWEHLRVVKKFVRHYKPINLYIMNKDKDFLPTCHIGFGFFLATHARVTTVHFGFAVPCSFSVTQPLPSPLLRQCIISCLLNTWRQSQWGNYWGHSHVCTQPSLTDCTSFRVEKRLCCCKGRSGEGAARIDDRPLTCQIWYKKCLWVQS